MKLGDKFKAVADDVNNDKAKELAGNYFNSIIKKLDEVSKKGSYYCCLKSDDYSGLYGSGAPLAIKHLKESLEPENINFIYDTDDCCYYAKF